MSYLENELKENKLLNIHNFLSNFYNQNKYIEIEYILTERLSVFNEKNIYIKDLFGGKDYNAVMVAAKIRGVRLIDNLIFS